MSKNLVACLAALTACTFQRQATGPSPPWMASHAWRPAPAVVDRMKSTGRRTKGLSPYGGFGTMLRTGALNWTRKHTCWVRISCNCPVQCRARLDRRLRTNTVDSCNSALSRAGRGNPLTLGAWEKMSRRQHRQDKLFGSRPQLFCSVRPSSRASETGMPCQFFIFVPARLSARAA